MMKTIYIVDDDQEDRMLLREAISDTGVHVEIEEFVDGSDLISVIQKIDKPVNVSMIMIDMNLPKMNGLETIAALRLNENFTNIPAIMLSTTSDPFVIQAAYSMGANHFSTKPDSFDELKNLVSFLIKKFITE